MSRADCTKEDRCGVFRTVTQEAIERQQREWRSSFQTPKFAVALITQAVQKLALTWYFSSCEAHTVRKLLLAVIGRLTALCIQLSQRVPRPRKRNE